MAVLNQNLNRPFVLFELTPANEISFLDSYKKTLSKCCIDPSRPALLSETGPLQLFNPCCYHRFRIILSEHAEP
jgi:hypothetical protein